jgi:outer membrane protein assembly factor BamD
MRKFVAIALFILLWGCGKSAKVSVPTAIDEPDRVLYEKAMKAMDRHNYQDSRLLLQTLISTYQDSDYFPKAKYALAETLYREGGRENLDSAEAAYKDFIVYFRDSELADDAQLMVAMTHVRRVQSPDRDNTEARLAELELKEMISSYPNSDLLEEAKQKLREVDEVLAEGSFKIANQYFLRKNYKASVDRYKEIEEKWPDYSRMDLALFNHAESLRLDKNAEASGKFYSEIVSNYPSSLRAKLATQRLVELKLPVPPSNPVAANRAPQQTDKGLFGKTFGLLKGHPAVPTDTSAASVRSGDGPFAVDSKPDKD